MMLFNLGRSNRLAVTPVFIRDGYAEAGEPSWYRVAWWVNGRLLGRYVSFNIPWSQAL